MQKVNIPRNTTSGPANYYERRPGARIPNSACMQAPCDRGAALRAGATPAGDEEEEARRCLVRMTAPPTAIAPIAMRPHYSSEWEHQVLEK